MTSFIIQSLVNRKPATSWAQKDDCAFCRIVQGVAPATKLYEDEEVIAILGVSTMALSLLHSVNQ